MARTGRTLPYPTIVALERALGLVENLPPGTRIDRRLLARHGFAANGISALVDALVFLGLVAPTGELTVVVTELRKDRAGLCWRALDPERKRLQPPYPNRKALAAALAAQVEMTATTLPLAATFLCWLADRAGVELVARQGQKPGARPGVPRPRAPVEARRPILTFTDPAAEEPPEPGESRSVSRLRLDAAAPAPPSLTAGVMAGVTFQVVVDRNTSREDIERMVHEVQAAIGRLGAGEGRGGGDTGHEG